VDFRERPGPTQVSRIAFRLRAKRSLPALLLESLDCLAGRNDWNTGGLYKLQKVASITSRDEICAARNGGCNHMVIIGVFTIK
jgi:hypothetical protein